MASTLSTSTSTTNNVNKIQPGSDLFPYAARIVNGTTTLTITIPTESKGDRVLSLDKTKFKDVNISDREQSIVDWLTEDAPVGISYEATVTLGEPKHLSALGQRIATKFPSVLDEECADVPEEDIPEQMKEASYVALPVKASNPDADVQKASLDFVRQTMEAKIVPNHSHKETIEGAVQILKKRAAIWERPHVHIEYDITKVSSKATGDDHVSNPSKILFGLGAMRKTKSGFFLLKEKLPYFMPWAEHCRRAHKRNRVWIYDVSEKNIDQMRADSLEMLRELLVELHTRLIENLGNAEQAFQEAMDKLTPEQRESVCRQSDELADKRANTMRKHLRTCQAELKQAVESAEQYDLSEETDDLVKALKSVLLAQTAAFNVQMRQQRRKTFAVDAFVCR